MIANIFSSLLEPLKTLVDTIDILLKPILNLFSDFVDTITNMFANIMNPLIQAISDSIDPLTQALQNLIQPISDVVQAIADTVLDPFFGEKGAFTEMVRKFSEKVLSPFTQAMSSLVDTITGFLTKLVFQWVLGLDTIEKKQKEASLLGKVWAMATVAYEKAKAMAAGIYKAITSMPFPLNLAAAATTIGTILALFGAIKFHKGGIVTGKESKGLSSDEVVAVLRKGEIVLPPDIAENLLDFFASIQGQRASSGIPVYDNGGVVQNPPVNAPLGETHIHIHEGAVQIHANKLTEDVIRDAADILVREIKWKLDFDEARTGAI